MPRTITVEIAAPIDDTTTGTRRRWRRWHGAILVFVEKSFPWRKRGGQQ